VAVEAAAEAGEVETAAAVDSADSVVVIVAVVAPAATGKPIVELKTELIHERAFKISTPSMAWSVYRR
jgi:hypothetical protein